MQQHQAVVAAAAATGSSGGGGGGSEVVSSKKPQAQAALGRTSVMKVASLKPEVEFDVIKLILLRENYIKKLEKTILLNAGMIDISVLGLIEIFRDCTIETVDTIRMWERTQVNFPTVVQAFIWNGQNYLQKIVEDIAFLGDYPELQKWLGFNPAISPFLVPLDIFNTDFKIDERSFVTFGKRPPVVVAEKKIRKVKYIKSPYATPIVNDADVMPSLNIVNKVMKQEKDKKSKLLLETNARDKANDPATDPYETYISFELLKRLKFCWKVLFEISPTLKSHYETFLSQSSQLGFPSILSEEKSFADSDATNETPASFKESQDDFFASLEDTVNPKDPVNLNKRLVAVGKGGANIWTPHDIILQRSVQKKGGELSVLTASGTQGRMIAPWRKSRFERLEIDLDNTGELLERIDMEVADIDSRNTDINSACKSRVYRTEVSVKEILAIEADYKIMLELKDKVKIHHKLLKYQLDHFKKLTAGGALGSLDHNKKWRNLEDATPLEVDEKLSMKLEDYCARRIQARVYIKFGRVMRLGLIRSRNRAATKIQTRYRYYRTSSLTLDLSAKIKVAIAIQKRWRGRVGILERKRLERLMLEMFATRLLQRVYRGYHGRKRFKLKLEFSRRIKAGADEVDPLVFQPGHVEEIADVIEVYLRDFFYQVPSCVLTVIRAIYFMLNGDSPEVVMIENCGYVENKLIYAESISWFSARLLLRRKGRFIRRVRDLIRAVNIPNPTRLKFNENCRIHLDCLNDLSEKDFDQVKHARYGILKLFRFTFHLMRIHKLQDMFPEYFEATQPVWFYRISTLKNNYELHRLNYMTESKCLEKINQNKERTIKEGKSIGPVTRATRIILANLKLTEKKLSASKIKIDGYLDNLRQEELKRIEVNENLERARFLGADIAQRDYKEYMNNNARNPNKDTVRDLRNNIDKKELDLLDTRANLEVLRNAMISDQKWRNFDAILKMKKLEEMSVNLGLVMGDLLVMNEIWKDFIAEVGGMQFVYDLIGEKKIFFEKVRVMSLALMKQRRDLMKKISKSLKDQFKRIKRLAIEEKRRILSEPRDSNTEIQKRSEANENRECARRDADAVESAKSRPDFVTIEDAPKTPIIVFIDSRLPMSTIDHCVCSLERINFRRVKSHQNDVPNLLKEMQGIIDDKQDIIFIADRGMHLAARAEFSGIMTNLIYGLIPNPKLVAIDGSLSLRFEDWHSKFKTVFPDPNTFLVKDSEQCTISLGKLRRIGLIFEKCMLESDPSLVDIKDTFEVPTFIKERFRDDFQSMLNDIAGFGDGNDSMSQLSSLENGGMVLAATVASILELWQAPTIKWKEKHIGTGCEHFLHLSDNPQLFCERLFLKPLPKCTKLMQAQMECAWSMRRAWDVYMQCSLIDYPARYLMAQWCVEAIRLINSCVEHGGIAGNQFKENIEYVYDVRWKEDIANNPDNMVGKVLSAAFKEYQIYESTNSAITYYFNRKSIRKAEQKIIGEKSFIQNVKVYHRGEFCYVSCDFKRESDLEPITYFQFMRLTDVVSMLSPNGIEIFEGRVTQYDISESGRHKWFELVSNWSRLDDIGLYFKVSLLRARHLMLSRIGFVSGYSSRYEIYEERLGDILILIHGISPRGAIEYRVDKINMAQLLAVCDDVDEKPQIEAMDTPAIASIYADRLEVSPSKVWQNWLADGELEPKDLSRPIKGKLRLNRGPGRFVGRQLVHIFNLDVLVSLYELTNETDVHTLRICMYELKQSQSVEFRLSPMERMALFNSDAPIISQIVERMKVVYCDLDDPKRTLIKLPKNFKPDRYDYQIEGDAEYDVLPISIEMNEIIKVKKEKIVYDPAEVRNDDSESENSEDDENVPKFPGVTCKKVFNNWGWAIYFNRNVTTRHQGNLSISFGLNTSMRGFLVTCLDNRKLTEAFRFIGFQDCVRIMKRFESVYKIEEHLRTLDEASVMELIDEFCSGLEIVPMKDSPGHHILQFKVQYDGDLYDVTGEGKLITKENIQIALLKEHNISETEDARMQRKRKIIAPRKVRIELLKIRGLSPNGVGAPRSPFCILRFNMREIGRSPIMKIQKKVNFKENNVFEAESNPNQLLQYCIFELEVFDTNYMDEQEDFLGSVKLNGEEGMKFLLSKDPVWYKLQPSSRYTDADNRFVSGKIEIKTDIQGDLSDAQEFFPHLMHLRKSKKSYLPSFELKLGGESVGKAISSVANAVGNFFKNPFGKKSDAEKQAEAKKKVEEKELEIAKKKTTSEDDDGNVESKGESSRGRSRSPKKNSATKKGKKEKRQKSKSPVKAIGNLLKGGFSMFGGKKETNAEKPEDSDDDSDDGDDRDDDEDVGDESEDEGCIDTEAARTAAEEKAIMFYVNKNSNTEYIYGVPIDAHIKTVNAYSLLSKEEQRRLPALDVDFGLESSQDLLAVNHHMIDNVRNNYLQLVKFGELNLSTSKRLDVYLSTGEAWPEYIKEGIVVVMRLNDCVVYRSPLFDDIDMETGSIWFRDDYISIELPNEYVSSHSLEISIWDRSEKINYAVLNLSGYRLSWLFQDRGGLGTTLPINFINEDRLFETQLKNLIQAESEYKEHVKLFKSLIPPSEDAKTPQKLGNTLAVTGSSNDMSPLSLRTTGGGGSGRSPARSSFLNNRSGTPQESRQLTPDVQSRSRSRDGNDLLLRQTTPDKIKSRMRSGSIRSESGSEGGSEKPGATTSASAIASGGKGRSESRGRSGLSSREGKNKPRSSQEGGSDLVGLGPIDEMDSTNRPATASDTNNNNDMLMMMTTDEGSPFDFNYHADAEVTSINYYSACPSRIELRASVVDLKAPIIEKHIDFSLLSYKNMQDSNKALAPAKLVLRVFLNNRLVKEVGLKKSDNQTYPYPLYGTSEKLRVTIIGDRDLSDCKLDFYIVEKEVLGATCYGFRRFDGDDLLALLDYHNVLRKFEKDHEEKLEEQRATQAELDVINDPMGLGISRPVTSGGGGSLSRPQSRASAAGGRLGGGGGGEDENEEGEGDVEESPSRALSRSGARPKTRGGVTMIPLEEFETRPSTVNNPSESRPKNISFPSRPSTVSNTPATSKGFFNVGNVDYMRSQGWGLRPKEDERQVMKDELNAMFGGKGGSRPGTSSQSAEGDRPMTAKPNVDPNYKPKPVTYDLSPGMEQIKGMKNRGFSSKLEEVKMKEKGYKYIAPKGAIDLACLFANPFADEDDAIRKNIQDLSNKIAEAKAPPTSETDNNNTTTGALANGGKAAAFGRPSNPSLNAMNALNKSRPSTTEALKVGGGAISKPQTPNANTSAGGSGFAGLDSSEMGEEVVEREDPNAQFQNVPILHSLVQNLPANILYFEIQSLQNIMKNGSALDKGHFMFEVVLNGISKHKSGPYSLIPDVFSFGGPVEIVLPKGLRLESCELTILLSEVTDDSNVASAQYVGGRTFKGDDLLAIAGCIEFNDVRLYNISPDITVFAKENYNYGEPFGYLCGLSFDPTKSKALMKPNISGSIVTKVRLNYTLDELMYIDPRLFDINYRKFAYVNYYMDLTLVSINGYNTKLVDVSGDKSKKQKEDSKKDAKKDPKKGAKEEDKDNKKEVKSSKYFVDVVMNGQIVFRSNLIELKSEGKTDTTSFQGCEKYRLYFPKLFPASSSTLQFVLWNEKELTGDESEKEVTLVGSFELNNDVLIEVETVLSTVDLSAKSLSEMGIKCDFISASSINKFLQISNYCKRFPSIKVEKDFSNRIELTISLQPGVSVDFTKKRYRNTSNNYRLKMSKDIPAPIVIQTNLPDDHEGSWFFDFVANNLSDPSLTTDELTAANLRIQQAQRDKERGQKRPKSKNSRRNGIMTSTFVDKSNDSAKAFALEQQMKAAEELNIGGPEEIKAKIRNIPKCELPAMSYIFKEKSNVEEDRICWRGRAMPRNFKATLETKKQILMSRSSRVIKTKRIKEAQVVAEVTYIKETTTTASDAEASGDTDGKLPICAKEIVSEGPGLVKRLYRIELSANNGQKMGHADILDSYDDFKDCLGAGGLHLIKDIRSSWVLGDIFSYIVAERCLLEILNTAKPVKKGAKQTADKTLNSSVYLIRDSVLLMEMEEAKKNSISSAVSSFFSRVGSFFDRSKAEQMAAEAATLKFKEEREIMKANKPPRVYWIRCYKTNKNLCGNRFRMTVLFESLVKELEQNTKDYIASFETPWHLLNIINVTVRCKETATRIVSLYSLKGSEIIAWISPTFPLDFSTKFRRAKFGEYLCSNITMEYNVKGEFTFKLQPEPNKANAKEDPSRVIPKELPATFDSSPDPAVEPASDDPATSGDSNDPNINAAIIEELNNNESINNSAKNDVENGESNSSNISASVAEVSENITDNNNIVASTIDTVTADIVDATLAVTTTSNVDGGDSSVVNVDSESRSVQEKVAPGDDNTGSQEGADVGVGNSSK